MASANWRTGHTLGSLLRRNDAGWDFLQLVRLLLNMLVGLKPTAKQGNDDSAVKANLDLAIQQQLAHKVNFRSSLAADYPPGEIRRVQVGVDKRVEVITARGGLVSPQGPLPDPFVEWLRDLEYRRDPAMIDFLDVFNHHLLVLRYLTQRATRPTLADLPALDSDSGQLLLALAGRRHAGRAQQNDLAVAGLLANCRLSLPVLRHLVAANLNIPLRKVSALQGGWVAVDAADHTLLGTGQACRLGADTTLGRRMWDQHKALQIEFGPLPFARLRRYLPGNSRHHQLLSVLRQITDCRCDCRVVLWCSAAEIPPPRLAAKTRPERGQMTLGLTSFLHSDARPKQDLREISFFVETATSQRSANQAQGHSMLAADALGEIAA